MKIVEALLDSDGCETLIALTYGCDLAWFERLLARPLRARGVRRFLVLADHSELSATIERQLDLISGAGRWYTAEGIRAAGSFHPKVYLLTGPDRARIWIGSGNLRASGLGRNREVFEEWEATIDRGAVPAVFEEFRRYLDRLLAELVGSVPTHIVDVLTDAFGGRVLASPRIKIGKALEWQRKSAEYPEIKRRARRFPRRCVAFCPTNSCSSPRSTPTCILAKCER